MRSYLVRPVALHSGMTLLACSLVLLGVAILASASLRSLQDDVSLTYSTIDRLLAHRAAEAALHDAATTLSMIPKNLTPEQAQGAHHLGDITGEPFAQGGAMQSCSVPEYVLEMLPQSASADTIHPKDSSSHRYRVTAKGRGLSQATMVVLQAEFETQACIVEKIDEAKIQQNDIQSDILNGIKNCRQNGTKTPVQNDEHTSDPLDTDCTPHVRRLAWRMLHES